MHAALLVSLAEGSASHYRPFRVPRGEKSRLIERGIPPFHVAAGPRFGWVPARRSCSPAATAPGIPPKDLRQRLQLAAPLRGGRGQSGPVMHSRTNATAPAAIAGGEQLARLVVGERARLARRRARFVRRAGGRCRAACRRRAASSSGPGRPRQAAVTLTVGILRLLG